MRAEGAWRPSSTSSFPPLPGASEELHELNLELHPKQALAFESPATELLYGGAAGGGKSHLMRIAAIAWCAEIAGLQVYLFRRVSLDLDKNHMEGPRGFRVLLAGWVASGWVRIIEGEIQFWNGSKIYLCHCEHEKHRFRYQGAEIHVLLIDELTHFSEVIYRFLRGRVRMVGLEVPPKYAGRFPRIICGANPGNIGHLFVKQMFVDGARSYERRRMPASEGGMIRQFIPALLDDNPSMLEDDPNYEARLEGLGSAELVKAMRWGDWNVLEGAFFDCWSTRLVIPPFTIPDDWLRFRSGDWGSNSPYSIGWWAVVQDDFVLEAGPAAEVAVGGRPAAAMAETVRKLPRGALVRYREDYGKRGGKLTAEQVAERIITLEREDPKLTYGVLDPSTFKADGGPSIAERINTTLLKARPRLAPFREADNRRVNRAGHRDRSGPMVGWDAVRSRMMGDRSTGGRPMIYFFDTCVDTIRTVPALQHDQARIEDLDTNGEDHAADDIRYACMSRPWLKTPPEVEPPTDGYKPPSELQDSGRAEDSIKTL